MTSRQTLSPSLADIEALAQAAERLPDLFRDHLGSVLLRVEDFPMPRSWRRWRWGVNGTFLALTDTDDFIDIMGTAL